MTTTTTVGVATRRAVGLSILAGFVAILGCDPSTGPDQLSDPGAVAFVGSFGSRAQLYTARPDGTDPVPVTDLDVAKRWYAPSPDGSKVAVLLTSPELGTDLWVMNRDGTGLVNLSNTPEQWDGWVSWSPDGTRLVYGEPVAGGGSDIWRVNADGSSPVNLTPPVGGHQEGGAVWSPDGSRLAFVSLRSGNPDIWVMDADGSDAVNLTQSEGSSEKFPAWSPDGSKIAFSRHSGGLRDIYVINPDGTGLQNLTQNPARDDDVPLWSPDGTRLTFTAVAPDAQPEVMVMNADGTGQLSVSDHPDLDYWGSWSLDGSMLAFTSLRDGLRQVYVVRADGTGLRRLVEPAAGESPRENWLESFCAWLPAE